MMRNPKETWYDFTSSPGALTLTARPIGLGDNANPSFLGRRQQHLNGEASTSLRWSPAKGGDRAGIAVVQSDEFWYQLAVSQTEEQRVVQLIRRAGPDDPKEGVVIAAAPLASSSQTAVRLRIVAREELYDFEYSEASQGWTSLARDVDGTILSTRKAGGFVGVTMGPFAISN